MEEFSGKWIYVRYIIVLVALCPVTARECNFHYHFNVGILSPGGKTSVRHFIANNIINNETIVQDCFNIPKSVTLDIEDNLEIPRHGWTRITSNIQDQLDRQTSLDSEYGLAVVIGPFYANMAMILQKQGIPYVITDYKGFDWVDSSRVTDMVEWQSVVEIRPPAAEVNQAIVDLCKAENWTSVVVILPDDPKTNQECKDLVNKMIQKHISPIPYSLSLGDSITDQTRDVLINAQMLQQRVLLTCSPRDETDKLIETVLNEAKSFGLLEDERNVFFLLDTSMYLEPLKEMNMYRKGFYAARCRLLAFRYTYNGLTGANLTSSHQATSTDAAELVRRAQTKYLQLQDGYYDPVFSKNLFLVALREVEFTSPLTGHLQFNDAGTRVNYSLQLVNHGGMKLFQRVGEWKPIGSKLSERLTLFKSTETTGPERGTIFDSLIKVVVVVEEPFVILKEGRNGQYKGNDRFEGFTIDILRELADMLQLKYEIYISPNNAYGSENANGSWNGMVGEVLEKRATLGMGAISITSGREKVVDFSQGIVSTGVNMLIHKPKEANNIFQFMEPFSLYLWLATVGASFFVSVVLFVMDYTNSERQFTVKETLWFSIGTLLMRGTDFSPRPTSQRIVTAGFTFFVLITVSTYTANMAAFLTTTNLEQPVTSLDELSERDDIECGTIAKSATMKFLKDGNKPVHRKIWKKITKSAYGLVDNSTVGRQRVEKGHYAFIFDYLINSYSEKNYCKTKMVGTPVRLQEHGIVMPAGASFKTKINIALLKIQEKNFIEDMKRKWWDNKRRCDNEAAGRTSTEVEFSIDHMAGVFIVGGVGMACSVAFFLFKKFYLLAKTDEEKDKKAESVLLDGSQRLPGDML